SESDEAIWNAELLCLNLLGHFAVEEYGISMEDWSLQFAFKKKPIGVHIACFSTVEEAILVIPIPNYVKFF
ncbi:hypothetical protein ACJX0J_036107, partial [Zea mays]